MTSKNLQLLKETFNQEKKLTQNKNNQGNFFRVQIAASKNSLDPNSYNFNGLKPIHKLKDGSYFKYYFSKSKSYKQIQKKREKPKKRL